MEETMETYAHLVKEGKVRAIGASNFSAERLLQALQMSEKQRYPAYQCIQPEYNLYDRTAYEHELVPVVQERGLSVVSYFSSQRLSDWQIPVRCGSIEKPTQ
jgi:aryl-alcohol dehydrogenase-like predicted oxidoreductase